MGALQHPERSGPIHGVRAALITLVISIQVLFALPTPSAMRTPFLPVMRLFGLNQSWAMFATPDAWPHRLEIHVDRGQGWELLYDRWDGDSWGQELLRYRRVRAIYDTATHRDTLAYFNLTRLIGRRIMEQDPQADRVRIRMVQTHTTLPGQPRDPHAEPRQERVLKRSALLPDDGLSL